MYFYTNSTNPDIEVSYTTEGAAIDFDSVTECDFAMFFLGYKWPYGLDNFKQLYGLC